MWRKEVITASKRLTNDVHMYTLQDITLFCREIMIIIMKLKVLKTTTRKIYEELTLTELFSQSKRALVYYVFN